MSTSSKERSSLLPPTVYLAYSVLTRASIGEHGTAAYDMHCGVELVAGSLASPLLRVDTAKLTPHTEPGGHHPYS
jgi:hypothetical protein